MAESTKKVYLNNPYPGIRSFNTNESNLFFGREKQITDLSEILKKNHFVSITGASGSGKSSIVKAGIIPWFLNAHSESEFVVFRPGNNPIRNLQDALSSLFDQNEIERKELKKHLSQLNKSDNALSEILNQLTDKKAFLLYIDQFEEIFRYRTNDLIIKSEELSDVFINNIINSVKNSEKNIFVIISLRSDFLSECAVFEGLPELINKGNYLLPNLSDSQKEEAITKPAEATGVVFSKELLEIIKSHVSNKSISLPVIQHALMRTWNNWLLNAPQGTPIDVEHYEAVGTVSKALSVHAEDIYNSLTENQKYLCEKIFRALTFWGDDERVTRSPQKLSDLCQITGAHEMEVIAVLDKFRAEGNSFILPDATVQLNHNSVIDITHESIMTVWERLLEWVENETKSAQLYLRLSKSAELYQAGKTGILVNPDLQIAINWLKNDKPNTAWAMRYDPAFDRVVNFIYYSKKEFEKAVAAEQARQERSLKRTRFIAFILGFASLVSILLMIVALNLRFKAQQSEKDAVNKQKLAEKQSSIAEERRKEAYALQLIAKQQKDIAEQNRLLAEQQKRYAVEQQKEALFQKQQAIIAKNEALYSRDLARRLQIEAEKLRDEAIEQRILIEQQKQRAELSEARTDTLRRLSVSKTLAIQAYKLYFDNLKSEFLSEEERKLPAILALQSYYFCKNNNGNIHDPDLFSALLVIAGKNVDIKNSHTDGVRDIYVMSNSNNLISVGSDGKVLLLNLFNQAIPAMLNTGLTVPPDFRTVEVSKDNSYIIVGSKDGKIFIWKSNALDQKPFIFYQSSGIISDIKYVSDNKFVAVDHLGKIVLYNLSETNFSKEKEQILSGKLVAADYSNGNIYVVNEQGKIYKLNENLEVLSEYSTDMEKVSSFKIVGNSNIMIGYSTGLLEILNMNGEKQTRWFAHNSAITKILASNSSKYIITSSYDKTIKIWSYTDLTLQPIKLDIHNNWVYSLALSNDEKYLISSDASGKIKATLIDIEELKKDVKNTVTGNMSEANWKKYVGSDIEYSPDLPSDL